MIGGDPHRGWIRRPAKRNLALAIILFAVALPLGSLSLDLDPKQDEPRPASQSPASEENKDVIPHGAWLTGLAAVLTAIATIIAAVSGARNTARRVSKDSMNDLIKDFSRFEAGMRMVLTKTPDSESIWQTVSNKLWADRSFRSQIMSALLFELFTNPEQRASLRGLLTDASAVARIAEGGVPAVPGDQVDQVVKNVLNSIAGLQKNTAN